MKFLLQGIKKRLTCESGFLDHSIYRSDLVSGIPLFDVKRFTSRPVAEGRQRAEKWLKGQMHSIVKLKPEPGAVYQEWQIPSIGLNDVLVRVEATSICGTDMQIYDWHEWVRDRVKPPFVMGHEFAGRVLEAGKEGAGLREGDLVSGETHIFCENVSSAGQATHTSARTCVYEE